MKKIVITVEQAEELEQDMGDYVSPHGGRADVKALLKKIGVPKPVASNIIARLESVASDISTMQDGEVERMYIDGISEDLKRLDVYLGKVFNVTGMRGKKSYIWEVWG